MRDVMVLFSGGTDSTVLVEMARRDERIAHLFYASFRHPARKQELRSFYAGFRRLRNAGEPVKCSEVGLLLRAEALDIGAGEPGARVVPGRNLAIIALAANHAAALGLSEVWIGATAADRDGYADCRPGYIAAASALTEPFGVRVRAPLADMSRAEVMALGRDLGAPMADAWSCYQPTPSANGHPYSATQCGTCNSCRQV